MAQNIADIIVHPVRMRIMQVLGDDALITQEIAERLPDVPKSSVYRHLKVLLEAELITVAETRLVKGIEEKTYRAARRPRLTPAEMAELSGEEHLRSFATYLLMVQQGFANYVQRTLDGEAEKLDFLADRTGYTEVAVYATDEEFDAFSRALNEQILPLLQNKAGHGRQRKMVIITHPLDIQE